MSNRLHNGAELSVLYLLNLIDLAFTLHATSHGGVELNPLMRCVPVMVAYKVIVVGVLCWWVQKQATPTARFGLGALTVLYGAVDLWHIINLLVIGGKTLW